MSPASDSPRMQQEQSRLARGSAVERARDAQTVPSALAAVDCPCIFDTGLGRCPPLSRWSILTFKLAAKWALQHRPHRFGEVAARLGN